jgi:CheY-like chemotaxis protein
MIGQLTERVLLVDDEPLARKLISRYLVAAGYVVRMAEDGLDAIGKLRTGLPDLIISDLKMPRMSGVELLHVVRKRFPQIPVIVISGMAINEIPSEVAADAYCHKSGSGYEQLLETMAELTRKPPLRTPSPHTGNKPVQARCDIDGSYVIECDDCLRVFRPHRAPNPGRDEKWATCVHCGKVVQFIVADREPLQ